MPEGDVVHLSARRLNGALAGQRLVRTDFRVPRLATADLAGRTVLTVVARGKHLLTRFDDGRTLHTHFRMDGSWHLYRPGRRWSGGPAHEVRVVLETAHWQAVGYRLPVVELLPTADEHRVVGHLGPDVLGPDWDLDEAVRRLRAAPREEVGTALLDQRNLAGLGNLYRLEALFLRGVSPWTPVGEVPELPRLVELARRLVAANADRWSQVTTGVDRRGRQRWVFERGGRPCRRCGTTVRVGRQGEPPQDRVTYWCPHCQPGPKGSGDAGAGRAR